MQKTLIALIILVLVGAGLYYVLTQYQPSPDTLSELTDTTATSDTAAEIGEDGVVSGTVVSVNTEQAAVDGPVLITLRQSNDQNVVIAVPSMGLPTCAARESIADAWSLEPGQFVEARGAIGVDDLIIPCESSAHYLHIIELQ